jgi:DNA polymerase-4
MNDQVAYRKIIHIDMDAFYASVEQRDHPEYRGKPLAVGGSRQRGVVAAASYEARAFGIHSAMPSRTAYRLCPQIIFVKPRFEVYRQVSQQIRAIFFDYTDLVEPLSLDEAYLDVTESKTGEASAIRIAKEIKQRIKEEVQLTASAGISINKFLAKTASDWHKPDGLTFVSPEQAAAFIEALPIEKFHGIGKVTAEKMKKWGVFTGADLKARSELELARKFGKAGRHYYRIAHAIDAREVKPHRERKSVSAENTFSQDLKSEEEMMPYLEKLCERVALRLQKAETSGRTVTLKIKYHDFRIQTRSLTAARQVEKASQLLEAVRELLYRPEFPPEPVRLLGVGVSNLQHEEEGLPRQLKIPFEEADEGA